MYGHLLKKFITNKNILGECYMKEIESFLKEHDLKSELLGDESFVSESKKLFEEQGLEFSRKQLEEIIEDISENLEDVKELPMNELNNIIGGTPLGTEVPEAASSSSPKKALGIAVKATTTILGTLLGAGLGFVIGRAPKHSTYRNSRGEVLYEKYTRNDPTSPAVIGGAVIGSGVGSVLGAQLGNMIVKKYNL